MKKRGLNIFLVLLIVLCLLPIGVLAENENIDKTKNSEPISITLILCEGLLVEDMDDNYKLIKTVNENGEIDPIEISCEDEGVFNVALAEEINKNPSIFNNNLKVTYNSENDILIISGAPKTNIELDMEEILNGAMKNIGAYNVSPIDNHTHCICGGSNSVGDHKSHTNISWQEWTNNISLPSSTGNWYLACDVELPNSNTWKIDSNIKICLNGHSITSKNTGNVIEVNSGKSLDITDCKTIAGIITHSSDKKGRGINNSGTLNLWKGIISGNTVNGDDGAGVENLGTFNMYGGSISNNIANKSSGFIGSGGEGGGVYNAKLLSSYAIFNMYGGEIKENSADTKGGGIYNVGKFNISGNVTISDNKKGTETNNVFIYNSNNSAINVLTDGMGTSASVGITGNLNQIVVNGTTNKKGFFSDNSSYSLATNDNSSLKLSNFIEKEDGNGSISMDDWTYGYIANNPTASSTTNGDVYTIEYKLKSEDDTAYKTTKPTDAGTYIVRATFNETDNYKELIVTDEFEIKQKELTINVTIKDKTYDGTNNATFNGNPTLIGVVDEDNVSLTNGTPTFLSINVGNDIDISFTNFSITGEKANNYFLTQPSNIKANINKATLNIKNLVINNKTYDGTNNATFNGEPELDGVISNDNLTLIKGTPTFSNINVGNDIAINFTEFKIEGTNKDNYTLIQPSNIKANINAYNSDKSEYSVNSNDWLNSDFIVTGKNNWKLSYGNTVDDSTWLDKLEISQENSNGVLEFYIRNQESGIISEKITEYYKIDKTSPSGKISIADKVWENFLSTISFDLFYKEGKTVTITASDASSGIASIKYLITDEVLNKDELENKEFNEYSNSFDISPNNKFIVYAKISDVAGNVTYLCSNGIILDNNAPIIDGADNNKTYCQAITLTISDDYLDFVKVNNEIKELNEGKLVIEPSDAIQTVVASDKAGNSTSISLNIKNGHSWNAWISNNNGTHSHKCINNNEHIETADCHGGTATCKDKAICVDCNTEYGELNLNNHSNLKHIEAKDPTTSSQGNIEYWYCDGCNKYYRNENSTDEISIEQTIIKKLPLIIKGDKAIIIQGTKEALSFTSDADYDDFKHVEVDDNKINEDKYTVIPGSTIITLNADYVSSLSVGTHTLSIVSINGKATAYFTVNKKEISSKAYSFKDKNQDGVISCEEEMDSANWIWSTIKNACVYKVSNTSVR